MAIKTYITELEGTYMAKLKGKGVVLAGLAAGAASFLSKKENRDKVMEYVNQAKEKVNQNGGVQNFVDKVKSATSTAKEEVSDTVEEATTTFEDHVEHVASTAGSDKASELEGHRMVDEGGAQEAIDVFNEIQQGEDK